MLCAAERLELRELGGWQKGMMFKEKSSFVGNNVEIHSNSMFARLGTDYEIRNQWFFAVLETMTTD